MTFNYDIITEWPDRVGEWPEKDHDDPDDVDNYPTFHPRAAHVGRMFFGDVCPFCGTPLSWGDEVRLGNGTEGTLGNLIDIQDHDQPAYHPKCYYYRQGELCEDITDY